MYHAHLCPDAYYYWAWSRDLAWSYYDGPPLIAYLLRLYMFVWGEREFSLYLFSLSSTVITTYLVWKCTLLLFKTPHAVSFPSNRALAERSLQDQLAYTSARYAVLLWLLTPGSLQFFTLQVTYNSAMILFWGLSFYYFLQIIHTQKRRYDYLLGISFGCLLLSKYTGILLILSLGLACLWIKPYRFVFKRVYLYLGLCLTCLLFSPVLIWNYQHHWSSFAYQLKHGFHTESVSHLRQMFDYMVHAFTQYQFGLLALFVLIWRDRNRPMSIPHQILLFPTAIVFCFFLIAAFFAPSETSWNAPFFFTGAILVASYMATMPQQKRLHIILFCCLALSSTCLIIGDRWPALNLRPGGGWGKSYAIHRMITQIPVKAYEDKPIFTNDSPIYGAMMTYFLKNHPAICPAQPLGRLYYACWQGSDSHQTIHRNKHFIYLSEAPLPNSSPMLSTCQLKQHYQSYQTQMWFSDMT